MELVNSYALSEVFKKGSKIKLVIVITQDLLVAKRGGDLWRIFQRVEEMFNEDMFVLEKGLLFVITKTDLSDIEEGWFEKI